jgi:hypothetical protein
MTKFVNTSGTNYRLEELLKAARDRLILISPFLKLDAGSDLTWRQQPGSPADAQPAPDESHDSS